MIDQLKAEISNRRGLARPNRFRVIITPPAATTIGNVLSLLCESTSIPGRQITSFEYPLHTYRQQIKVPNGYLNEDITMSFLLTNDHVAMNFFQEWSSLVLNRQSYSIPYLQDYAGTIEMLALDETNTSTLSVKLYNAWPVSINSIELNNSSSDDYIRVPVTITYEDFQITDPEIARQTASFAQQNTNPAIARITGAFGTF